MTDQPEKKIVYLEPNRWAMEEARTAPYIALVRVDGTEHHVRVPWCGTRLNAALKRIEGDPVCFDGPIIGKFDRWRLYDRAGQRMTTASLSGDGYRVIEMTGKERDLTLTYVYVHCMAGDEDAPQAATGQKKIR